MLIHGEFTTKAGETCRIEITTHASRDSSFEIGGAPTGVLFTDDPVEITCEAADTFTHIIRSSASIRLLSRRFIPELFSCSVMEAEVLIFLDGRCVFAGFVEPRTYSQPFSDLYDEIEVNCIDLLSALQYVPFIGEGADYESRRQDAAMRSFGSILNQFLIHPFAGGRTTSISFDGSIALPDGSSPLTGASIHELLFLADDEEGMWTRLDTVEEIARYLNLHVRQEGLTVRLFSLDAIGAGKTPQPITTDTARGTDTQISVGEVYNRIELTCDVTDIDTVVESPLDADSLSSPFTNRQLYLTEYIDDLSNNPLDAGERIRGLLQGNLPVFPENTRRDWYIQMKDSLKWRFLLPALGGADDVRDFCDGNVHQERTLNLLAARPGACLCAYGKVEYKDSTKDNSPTTTISMADALFVSVNGNGEDTAAKARPDADMLKANIPVAQYVAPASGGSFSPADDETTNYIVIRGKISLLPLLKTIESKAYFGKRWSEVTWPATSSDFVGKSQLMDFLGVNPSKNGDRLYIPRFWLCANPYAAPQDSPLPYGFLLPVDDLPETYPYARQAADTVSKVSVLQCMLRIGGKCLVETGTQGQPSDFEWRPFKTREQCASDDEFYLQSFSIGFDPKLGDSLIGPEYDIQNNISFEMGLDMEGTAIPIRRGDNVSGRVEFSILGPVNLLWSPSLSMTTVGWTFYKARTGATGDIPLMAHVSSVCVRDFEVVVTTDNALVNNASEEDIVYVSDTDERFVNKRDDLSFRITTALTREERVALGVSDSVKLSAPALADGSPLLKLTNTATGDTAKPEQLYVDARWREWHLPRVTLEQTFRSSSGADDLSRLWTHPALPGKIFYPFGLGRNLMDSSLRLTLKEK